MSLSSLSLLLSLVALLARSDDDVKPGCRYKGQIFQNNDTWEEKAAFKMKCIVEPNGSWRTQVVACITPNKLIVPLNGTAPEGPIEWSCELSQDGTIMLTQQRGKNADCDGGHKSGETWTEKTFQFKCDVGGITKFVGCIAPNGEQIANGDIKEVNGFKMLCKNYENGTIALQGLPKEPTADCVDRDGNNHPFGSTWVENVMFEYKCEGHGAKKILGCVVKEAGLRIPIGESREAGGTTFHCEEKDGAYRFYSTPTKN